MAVKSSELRSGIFVVLAMVVLTILIFSVGNFRTRLRPAVRFYTYLHDVKFLKTAQPRARADAAIAADCVERRRNRGDGLCLEASAVEISI